MKRAILIMVLACGSVWGHEITVVNIGTNAAGFVGTYHVYPVGITKIPLRDGATLPTYAADFGASGFTPDTDSIVYIDDGTPNIVEDPQNVWGAFAAGMGGGFMWFGFGWILRLTKKVGSAPADF